MGKERGFLWDYIMTWSMFPWDNVKSEHITTQSFISTIAKPFLRGFLSFFTSHLMWNTLYGTSFPLGPLPKKREDRFPSDPQKWPLQTWFSNATLHVSLFRFVGRSDASFKDHSLCQAFWSAIDIHAQSTVVQIQSKIRGPLHSGFKLYEIDAFIP